jgi:hypothetical protein
MLARQRGKAFDPQVVDAFLAHADELIGLRDDINRRGPDFDEQPAEPAWRAPGAGRP